MLYEDTPRVKNGALHASCAKLYVLKLTNVNCEANNGNRFALPKPLQSKQKSVKMGAEELLAMILI